MSNSAHTYKYIRCNKEAATSPVCFNKPASDLAVDVWQCRKEHVCGVDEYIHICLHLHRNKAGRSLVRCT